VFRPATLDDVDDIVALVESAYRGPSSEAGWTTEAHLLDGQRTDPAAVRDVLGHRHGRVLLALDGSTGDLVGCCQVERRPDGVGYFGMFAVRPGLQGRGLGRAVVAEAERLVFEEWGVRRMTMSVLAPRLELIDWYERLGYGRTGETAPFPYGDERYGQPKVDDLVFVVLAKDLGGDPTVTPPAPAP
jgi:ribosomal protein S18 acetylase RimI-like enzyme